jgi:hypothetical protein
MSNWREIVLIVLSTTLLAASVHAEQIRIRLVDGRNGRAVTDERLSFRVGTDLPFSSLTPDTNGVFVVDAPRGKVIQIFSNHLFFDCRELVYGDRPSYSVDEILDSGISLPNTCGRIHSEARRGEIVLHVGPFTWWERWKAEVDRSLVYRGDL